MRVKTHTCPATRRDDLVLFRTLTGSKLYGTNTPSSDHDVMQLVLPNKLSLLRGNHALANSTIKTNNVRNTKNTQADVDITNVPLQVFARDFLAGQTYALELAFAIDGAHAEQSFISNYGYRSLTINFITELRTKFLSKSIKAMLGYVLNQANLYSFKGERLNAANEFHDALRLASASEQINITLADKRIGMLKSLEPAIQALAKKYPKYIKIEPYDIGEGRTAPAYKLLDRVIPFSSSMTIASQTVKNLIDKYGQRSKTASETNVDWKAMMHAVRIADQGLVLMQTKGLRFPVPKLIRQKYLAIRAGKFTLDEVRSEIEHKLYRLQALEERSELKTTVELRPQFDAWLDQRLLELYEYDSFEYDYEADWLHF